MNVPASLSDLWSRALQSRFLRDVRFLASGVAAGQVLLLAASPLLTRLFPPESFGAYSLVMATAAMMSVFATLRIESVLPVVKSSVSAIHLLRMLFLSSTAVAIAVSLALAMFHADVLALLSLPQSAVWSLFTLPALILVYAAYSGFRFWLFRRGNFKAIGRGQISRVAVNLATSIGIGVLGFSSSTPGLALLIGQLAGDLFYAFLLARCMTTRDWRLVLSFQLDGIRKAYTENSALLRSLVSSQALAALYGRMPVIAIAAAYGPAVAGWYGLAERIVGAPAALVANAIGDVYRQRAASAFRAGRQFDALMRRVLLVTLALSLGPFLAAMWLTPHYLGDLLGSQWQPASFTVSAMLAGALIAFNSTPVDKAAIIVGASAYIFRWHVARFAIEASAAVAAVMGAVEYATYLVAVITGRSALYIWDIRTEHQFARRGSL